MPINEYLFKFRAVGGNDVKKTFNDVASSGDAAFKGIEQSSANSFKYAKMAIGGIATLASINHFAGMVKNTINAQDELDKMSQKVGMSVEELSKLNYAATLSDVSTEQLKTGLVKLNKGMVDAASGTGSLNSALSTMGISIRNSDGSMKSNGQILNEMADKFASYKDGAQKGALANAAFGKSGAELIPLLNGGSKAIKDAGIELDKFGGVVTTANAKASAEFNDNLKRLEIQGNALYMSIGNALLPTMSSFIESLIRSKSYLSDHKSQIVGVATSLGVLGAAYLYVSTSAIRLKAITIATEAFAASVELAKGGAVAWSVALATLNKTLGLTKLALIGTGIGAIAVAAGVIAEKYWSVTTAIGEDRIQLLNKEKKQIEDSISNYEKYGKSEEKLNKIRENGLSRIKEIELEINSIRNPAKQKNNTSEDGKNNAPELIDAEKVKRQAAAIEEIIIGARRSIEKDQDKFQRSINNSLLGENDRKLIDELSRVDDLIKDRQEQIQKMLRKGDINEDGAIEAANKLDIIKNNGIKNAKELMNAQIALNNSWKFGAAKALRTYADDASNVAKRVENVFLSSTKSMEDALVSFVRNGKTSFSNLANSIIDDMIRIQIRQSITGPLASAASSFFGSMITPSSSKINIGSQPIGVGSSAGFGLKAKNGAGFVDGIKAFASGGTFTNSIVNSPTLFKFANGTGLMGEAGPEAILPLKRNSSGQLGVVSSGGNGNISINVFNNARSDGIDVTATTKHNDSGVNVDFVIRKSLSDDIRSNGQVSQMLINAFGLRRTA